MLMLAGPKLAGARLRVSGLFFLQHSESGQRGGCRPCAHWPQLPACESDSLPFQPGGTTLGSLRRCSDDSVECRGPSAGQTSTRAYTDTSRGA